MTTPDSATAAVLRRALANSTDGFVMAELAEGLYLQLARGAYGTLTLTLRREAAFPTVSEITTWVEAFGVPDGTDNLQRRSWASTHPKTQRQLRWRAVTLTWREIEPVTV